MDTKNFCFARRGKNKHVRRDGHVCDVLSRMKECIVIGVTLKNKTGIRASGEHHTHVNKYIHSSHYMITTFLGHPLFKCAFGKKNCSTWPISKYTYFVGM